MGTLIILLFSVWYKWVFGHEFIRKENVCEAKLFGVKAPLSSTRQLHRWSKVTQGCVGISSITPICPSSHLRSGFRMCDGDLCEDISRHRDSCLRFSWGDKITCCDRLGSCSHLSLGSLGPSSQLPLSESGQGFLTTCPGWAEGPWHPIFSLMTQQGYCSDPTSKQCTVCWTKLVNLININYKFSMQCIQFAWNESPINKIQITGLLSVMDESASLSVARCSQYILLVSN